jgi:hypothetical protein
MPSGGSEEDPAALLGYLDCDLRLKAEAIRFNLE